MSEGRRVQPGEVVEGRGQSAVGEVGGRRAIRMQSLTSMHCSNVACLGAVGTIARVDAEAERSLMGTKDKGEYGCEERKR